MTSHNTPALLSGYDQSLGSGMPPFFRMMHFDYLPDVPLLAAALRRTLVRYPRLAMRLQQVAGGGLAFAQVAEPQRLELRPAQAWAPEQFSLEQLPAFVPGLDGDLTQPMLGAALTPVSSGAVLSASLSHVGGDFCSLYLFFAGWSECYRALRAQPAQIAPEDAAVTDARASSEHWRELLARTHANEDAESNYTVVHFSRAALTALRAELASDGVPLTLNEVLTAFIVHRYGDAIMGRANDLRLRVPVNVRGVHPKVPEDFIGNAIVEAIVPLPELRNTPEAARQTALKIHEAVRAARTTAYIESALDVRGDHVELKLTGVPVYNRKTDILSTNLSKMPFHQLDFGGGPPRQLFGTHTVYRGLSISAAGDGLDVRMFGDDGGVAL